ncbi:tetratricopeptide repeat protein [Spirosoma soli]|uniref:histidine kinase n=1 Tax=Spirosoma soli TaxID=1770529 RepID=A0ABW5MBL6_9BACT
MKKRLLIFCLSLTLSSAFAQSKRIDSLWTVLKKHPQADTFRVNRLNDLTNEWGLQLPQYDSLANQALLLARKLNYPIGEAKALFTLGITLYATHRNNPAKQEEAKQGQRQVDQAIQLVERAGDKRLLIQFLTGAGSAKRVSNTEKKQSLAYGQRALSVAQSLHDPKLISDCQRMIALYYDWANNNYAAALQWNFQALRTAQQGHCQACALASLRAIANNYTALNDNDQALRYLTQALTISQQEASAESREFQFSALSSIGNLYLKVGRSAQSIQVFERAIQVRKTDYPAITLAHFDKQLSAAYESLGRYPLAIFHAQRGLAQARQDHNAWAESATSNTLSRAYLHTGKLDSAQFYGVQSLSIAQQTHKKDYIRDASQTLAELYAKQGKYADAYRYQGLYFTYRDSLNNEDVTRKATAAQFTHQIKQQQSQIQLQAQTVREQRFQRNVLLAGGLMLLLLGAAVAAWLLNRARLRRLEEAQALRKQIAHDLHDEVGSTLSSISLLSGMVNGLIAQNRPESVERAIAKINTDARQILESVDEIIWTINPGNDSLQRIAFRLQEYAQPLMESKNIQFTVSIDPTLDSVPISMEVRRNLYLIGKEAINNLVKYSQATQATLRFDYQKDQLKVTIEDNGQGFDITQPTQRTGQESMQQRAKAMGGNLTVRSAPGQGTMLELTATAQ